MAGQSGKRSPTPQSASQRSSHGTASGGAASPFALVPLGKHEGKPAIPLTRPVLVIGSRSSSRIHLNSSSVSQSHALLVRNGGTYYIHDLASRTHVFVSGQRVRNQDLADGATLNIGSFTLKFTGPAAAPARRRRRRHCSPQARPSPRRSRSAFSDWPPARQRCAAGGRGGLDFACGDFRDERLPRRSRSRLAYRHVGQRCAGAPARAQPGRSNQDRPDHV